MAAHHFWRIRRLAAQFLGGVPSPAWIPHRATCQTDHVGLAGRHDVFGLLISGNEPDRHCGDTAFFFYFLGERHLITRRERDFLSWIKSAAGHIHIVYAAFFELLS